VKLEAKAEGMILAARTKKLLLKLEQKRFDVSFEVPSDAPPGRSPAR